MQKLIIKGKKKLSGSITISGSKNASLPILAATILNNNKTILKNVPFVKDVSTMIELLKFVGLKIKADLSKKKLIIHSNKNLKTIAPYKLLKTMRAGVLVLGPLLAKFKKAKVSLPGGCAIGTRPVNLHLFALEKLGAKIKIKNGYIYATAKNGLKGRVLKLGAGGSHGLTIFEEPIPRNVLSISTGLFANASLDNLLGLYNSGKHSLLGLPDAECKYKLFSI